MEKGFEQSAGTSRALCCAPHIPSSRKLCQDVNYTSMSRDVVQVSTKPHLRFLHHPEVWRLLRWMALQCNKA